MKRNWSALLVCLLISFGIWLVYNLSLTYTHSVSVGVLAVSNIDGRAPEASAPVEISAVCRASGFKLISLLTRDEDDFVRVQMRSDDFSHLGGDSFVLHESSLHRYISAIFGSGVTVDAFTGGDKVFEFAKESHRRIPVVIRTEFVYRPQYMAAGPIELEKDSVLVYGEPSRLEAIPAIYSKSLRRNDLHRDFHGTVKLETPSGTRLETQELQYWAGVVRFIEVSRTMPVSISGVPEGVRLVAYPSTVDVVLRCSFPLEGDPFEGAAFFVTYSDYVSSRTGNCIIRSRGLGDEVISVKLSRDICNCVEIGDER